MASRATRIKHIGELLENITQLCKYKDQDSFAARNTLRRSLYKAFDALRSDDPEDEKLRKLTEDIAPVLPLECQSGTGSKLRLISSVLRGILFVTWGLSGSLVIILLSWLRLFDPFFRRLGFQNGKLPFDLVLMLYTGGFLARSGVSVAVEGAEHLHSVPEGQSSMLMFSHASNLDPFILTSTTPLGVRWIGKRSLFLIPIFGWAALLCGMMPVSRSNRQKAIASLNAMLCSVKGSNRPIGISPEGTRSRTEQLLPTFKKGPFYMREETKSTIIPALIVGAYELWPPSQPMPSSGKVTLRFLPPIPGDAPLSREETSSLLRQRFVDALDCPPSAPRSAGHSLGASDAARCIALAAVTLGADVVLFWFLRWASISSGLSTTLQVLLIAFITATISTTIIIKY